MNHYHRINSPRNLIFHMKIPVFLTIALVTLTSISAEQITLNSKDGRKISASLIQVHSDSVEVRREDGEQFTISFEKLDKDTVEMLKNIALEEKEAAIAEQKKKIAAEEAEQARIPKFTKNPKTPADIPEKIVIKAEDGKEFLSNQPNQLHPVILMPFFPFQRPLAEVRS